MLLYHKPAGSHSPSFPFAHIAGLCSQGQENSASPQACLCSYDPFPPMQACAAKVTDTLMNYETVKYFNNDEYEQRQYAKAIAEYQKAE